ncbi:DUF2846 domain-containing protein [Moraxella atlantae]|uniref:Protein of uncharacterized function (DUF2846) n=1 Tax=Faucicola atlantae TaxID=34059 RepID=A0A378QL95_9GAMM|nr:DUF2846 domain-containing protein [Moraxella atlantae]OPH33763.1 hypothetical protein B5J92_09155 [Moraxella atlantae]STZ01677.1 Protein of uncharacterised function (DUF2846) [Moraxella atlantae]
MKKIIVLSTIVFLFTDCASVPLANKQTGDVAKQFILPPVDKAGLYIYRIGGIGASLKKDIKINGNCVGESTPNTFFYQQVPGNQEYTITTESEFSPNAIKLFAKGGSNYFIKQYIKPGLLVGGANLKIVDSI